MLQKRIISKGVFSFMMGIALAYVFTFTSLAAGPSYDFDIYVEDITNGSAVIGTDRITSANEFYGINCDEGVDEDNFNISQDTEVTLKKLEPQTSYTCRMYIYYSPNGGQVQGISNSITFKTLSLEGDHILENIHFSVESAQSKIFAEWELIDPVGIDGVAITVSTQNYQYKEFVPEESEKTIVEIFSQLKGDFTFYDLKNDTDYWIGIYPFYLDADDKKVIVDSDFGVYNTNPEIKEDWFDIFVKNLSTHEVTIGAQRTLSSFEYYVLSCSSHLGVVETDLIRQDSITLVKLVPGTPYTCRMYIYHSDGEMYGRSSLIRFITPGGDIPQSFILPPINIQLVLAENKISKKYEAKLHWEDTNTLEGYNVYRSKNDGSFVKLNFTSNKNYTDTSGLEEKNEYCYYVTGVGGEFESEKSSIACLLISGDEDEFLPKIQIKFEDEVIADFDTVENPFPDVNTNLNSGKAAVELFYRGVLGGYPDGQFKGSRKVNRAEAAKFLLLARYGDVDDMTNNGKFFDVVPGEWYVKYVMKAAELGIINGYIDSTFKPAQTVTTAEFLKMLTKTFELEENLPYGYLDVPFDSWFSKYAGTAEKYQLFPFLTTYLNPNQDLTRNEVAVSIYHYFKNRE